MKIPDLQTLLKFLWLLILSMLPFYSILAQDTTGDQTKKVRIKMFKNINGDVQVTDTVMNAADYAEALSSVKGLKADTAMFRKLYRTLSSVRKVDSIRYAPAVRDAMFRRIEVDRTKLSDSEQILRRLHTSLADTGSFKALKNRELAVLMNDSSRHRIFKRHLFSEGGDTIRIDVMMPGKSFRILVDSMQVLKHKDGKVFRLRTSKGAAATGIHEIRVDSSKSHIFRIDTSGALITDHYIIRASKDSVTGKHRVYAIGKDDLAQQIEVSELRSSDGDRNVIMILKTDVRDLSTSDKKKLQQTGNKVEANKKEALKINNVDFYPNPNNGRFNLQFTLEEKGDATIRIMNSSGKEIYAEKVKGIIRQYNKQIDISGLGKGIFFLQVVQGDRYATKKILVQ